MNSIFNLSRVVAVAVCGLALVACDSIRSVSEEDYAEIPPPQVLLGGTISGLGNSPVVLQNNGSGNRSFSTTSLLTMGSVPQGASYNITVLTQPQNRTCTVVNPSGTANAAVSNIQVNCVINAGVSVYNVSGTISGGAVGVAGLQLRLSTIDGTETINPGPAATSFAFALPLLNLTNYTVTATYPGTGGVTNNCGVVGGAGTINSQNANTLNVNACVFTISGSVAYNGFPPLPIGANGVTLALINALGAELESVNVAAAGNFQFLTPRNSNAQASYVVAVKTQPAGQTCVIRSAGTASLVLPANVAALSVACQNNPTAGNGLAGTYKFGRNYLSFLPNGTFIYGTHASTSAASGVEHGFYVYNSGTGSATFTVTTDSDGTASGISGTPGQIFGFIPAAVITRSAGPPATLIATFGTGPTAVTWSTTAVTSTAAALTGAWLSLDGLRLFVYNSADQTGVHVGVNGAANLQDVCLLIDNPAAAAGSYVQDRNAQCRPGGMAAVDTSPAGFAGGLPGGPPTPQRASEPTNFTVTAAVPGALSLQATYDGAAVGTPVAFGRSVPN